MTAAASANIDSLPPTQYLILEVLAARTRLGEHFWTFPTTLRPHVRRLCAAGLVNWEDRGEDLRVSLTDDGRSVALFGDYELPDVTRQRDRAQAMLAKVADLAMGWRDERGNQLMLILTEGA